MKKLFTVWCLLFFANVSSFSQIVIYEIYGGGGNSGASYKNDYIVLFNPTGAAVNLASWSIQYASAAGTAWEVQNLIGTIPANGYFLVSFYSNPTPNDGLVLPTPNVVGATSININAINGKIALRNTTAMLSGSGPFTGDNSVQDFVGYGSANAFEGTAAANAGNSNNQVAVFRKNPGSIDTNQNSVDFGTRPPNPQNSPLPVQLTYFQTEPTDNQRVNVRWETAQEINSNVFVVERSRNAVDYKTIAKVEAAGESNTLKRYSFTDESALFGTNYYRLSQIDKDGTTQVFRPQAVVIEDASLPFGVFANPVFSNTFNVKVEDADEASFVMNDLNGRAIALKNSKLNQTIVEITPSENLPLGMYILQVQTAGSLKKHKVLVVK
jgi:hypothetical protein